MKTVYTAGEYYIKVRGRGVTKAKLTKQEAKTVFKFQKKGIMEIEGVSNRASDLE